MSLHVIFVLAACVYSTQCWSTGASGRFPGTQDQQLRSSIPNRPQCFGLARRTRQLRINVPVIYNLKTGQTSPVPSYLYTADENVITRIENEGWEVRRTSVYIPQLVYERVPICCSWDQNCYQGRAAVPVQTSEASGSCANGGQLIYRDGQQRCECQPGFFGSWCQMYDKTSDSQSRTNFPSGPLIRVVSTPYPNIDPLKEAELRRSKGMRAPMQPDAPRSGQVLSAAARPLAYRAALLKQQILKAKMAHMEEMYRQAQGNVYNHMQQQGMSPYEVGQNNNMWGRNPYNTIDGKSSNTYPSRQNTEYNPYNALAYQRRLSGQDTDQNPYNALSYQGQLPPNMMRAFSAVQDELRQNQAINPYNPYSRLPQEMPRPHPLVLNQRMNGDPNLYNRRPSGMDMPQARTPWDLDPFGQQQNPSYMNYPGMAAVPDRNKQAMAMALYQQMINQQRARLSNGGNSMNGQPLNVIPVVVPGPAKITPVRESQPRPLTASSIQEEKNESVQAVGASTGAQIAEQQQPSTNGQPETPLDGPIVQQVQPITQAVMSAEQCQAVLTVKLNACLKDYGLVMEQFTNPEFMQKARAVCAASESVGRCIMQHDKACGEGDAILSTRRMINSALQMMGMICQQISARDGDMSNVPPMQGPLGSPQGPPRGAPMEENQPEPPNNSLPSINDVMEPTMYKEEGPTQDQALPRGQNQKSFTANSPKNGGDLPEALFSEGNMGHDSAQPISMELKLFGYPLWLVVSLGLALFVALILFVVVMCLCCRRRCGKKSKKEIEKMPIPIDSKICTIDLAPPSYNTTVINQNDDAFSLPPLKLDDEDSVHGKFSTKDDSDNERDDKEKKNKGK